MIPILAKVAVDLSKISHTDDNYYAIARFFMKIDHAILDFLGLGGHSTLFLWLYAILIFVFAFGIGWAVQLAIVWITRQIARRFDTDIYQRLREHSFFKRTCRIISPIIFLILLQFTMTSQHSLAAWLARFTWIYILFLINISLCIIIDVSWEHIDARENRRKLPLKGLVQLIKGILWIITIIIAVALLLQKSPGTLLAGLGAFSAVLMLVFKDNILGVVAGVQLSENDSLHVGDWIKVPGTEANGTVKEVTLVSVKVENWDKTVTTLPPYSLMTGSFTNYRNMQQSNTRRIQRSYSIDADSVVPLDEKMLDEYARIPLLSDWIAKKRAQKAAGNVRDALNPDGLVDGSIETNLGVFRAYLKLYLDAHPLVDHTGGIGFCFVTTLPQTANGIPLQIYCFTSTSVWLDYEAIQASIFEHIAVMLYRFGLYTFENATGRDNIINGYISPGKNMDTVFGLPYPFYLHGGLPESPGYPRQQSAYPQPSAMQPAAPAAPAPSTPPSQPPVGTRPAASAQQNAEGASPKK